MGVDEMSLRQPLPRARSLSQRKVRDGVSDHKRGWKATDFEAAFKSLAKRKPREYPSLSFSMRFKKKAK